MAIKLSLKHFLGFKDQLFLLALPILFVASELWVRIQGGPNWLWFNLDPDYFYLLDALNILNFTTPGHVYHPGTTVQLFAALVLKLSHPLTSSNSITDLVLASPEKYLQLISIVLIFLNGLALWCLGLMGRSIFGSFTLAGILQLSPFISMVILKHSYHVKPESFLLFGTLVLAILLVKSLTPKHIIRYRLQYAVAFGLVAGFGIATKITVFPIYFLPFFVLGQGADFLGWGRAVIIYGISASVALLLFTLPALPAYEVFVVWLAKIFQGPGAYGGGTSEEVFDLTVYVGNVIKLFKRPAFHIVFIFGLFTLITLFWKRTRSSYSFGADCWLLIGILFSQLAQVLLVAKQPNAMYLIPSFTLIPLAFVIAWRIAQTFFTRNLGASMVILFAALIVSQGMAIIRLGQDQAKKRIEAQSINMSMFQSCAKLYSYSASSPSYALMLADFVTKNRMAKKLADQAVGDVFWLEHWWDQSRVVLRDWNGPINAGPVLANFPCLVIRASHWYVLERLLPSTNPKLIYDKLCFEGNETLAVRGADCSGLLKSQ